MKNWIVILAFCVVIPNINAETGIFFFSHSYDQMILGNVEELIQIKGNDVIVEYDIEIDIINMSQETSNPQLKFYFTKGQDIFFHPKIIEYMACQPDSDNEFYWGHSYRHMELNGCNNLISVNLSKHDFDSFFSIDKKDINLKETGFTPVYFRIIMIYPNYTIKRPDQNIFWNVLEIQPDPRMLRRYLVTDNDALITSLRGYKIERYDFDTNEFILSSKEEGEMQIFYKNDLEERNKKIVDMIISGIIGGFIALFFGYLIKHRKNNND